MRARAGLSFVWLLLAPAGCAQPRSARVEPVAVPDPCTGPGADTAGWQTVDAGSFRFSVPPEYRRRRVRGIDSYVGRWQAPRRRVLGFDWGVYSWSGDDAADRLVHYRECATEIGGHAVKLISGYDARGTMSGGGRKYVVTGIWRDVLPGTHLTLGVYAPDPADLPELLSIIRSIRFDPPELRAP